MSDRQAGPGMDRPFLAPETGAPGAGPPPRGPDDRSLAEVARLTGLRVIITDAQRRITWVNDAFTRHTGWTLDDVVGRTPGSLLRGPDSDPVQARRIGERLAHGLSVQDEEVLNYTRDGRTFWSMLDIHPVHDERGAIVQFVAVHTDLTQRRRDEEALRASRAELSAVFDAEPHGLVLLRRDGSVLRSNAAGQRLFGFADGIGVPLRGQVAPEDGPAFDGMLAAALRGTEAAGRFSIRQPGGESAPVQVQCVPVFENGRVARVLAVARDVTEELAAQTLRIRHGVAEAANQAKADFIARVSHELRTPLNAILGFAQLLESGLGTLPEARQREHLAQVLTAGHHLSALIGDLLDLSRIESRTLVVDCQPTALASAIDRTMAMFTLVAEMRQVRILRELPTPGPVAMADHTRLTQVLSNLLSNAIKYNTVGGWVRLSCGGGERPWVEVADGGPGLSDVQRAHLFEPFNRLGAERSGVEGTGIGLVISRQLVGLMGGTLGLVDRDGASTAFRIELLPVAHGTQGSPPSARGPGPHEPRITPSVNGGGAPGHPRVLYVEDDAVNTLLMRGVFESMPGWTLDTASTAAEGLRRASATPPDLILLDMHLPDGTGLDVRQALMQNAGTASVPCILLTADASEATRQRAMALGFAAVQHKPLCLDRMGPVLRGAVEGAAPAAGPVMPADPHLGS